LSVLFQKLLEQQVEELLYCGGGKIVVTTVVAGEASRFLTALVPGSEAELFRLAINAQVGKIRHAVEPQRVFSQMFSFAVPLLLVYFWYRAAKHLIQSGPGMNDNKYVPSRGKKPTSTGITFKDVVSKSKVELMEIVDYLNNPAKYKAAGARMPRGALLVGPSGTGKTLLARAVAGEARCQFICASAAEFVEVYVGRGAARIRDLFQQARSSAPAVLFIDELDAIGNRSRMSVNEEYVQTVNQILTELDGFHGHTDGVVVLAATNRREAIDPALLRPGRFDRFVFVELPLAAERLEILQLHASKAAMAMGLAKDTLMRMAEATEGFNGAELANLVNEALFMAMRSGRQQVALADLESALKRAQSMQLGQPARPERGSAFPWMTQPVIASAK